jgi:Fur family ferric uptake transcriptional regulator
MSSPSADARMIPDLLVGKSVRLTAHRRAVVDVLVDHAAPLAVAEIHAWLRKRHINLVSVYGTVRLLSDLGLVRLADESRGAQRFELSEPFTGHHHHLVCQERGQVEDLEGCGLEKKMLEALNRRVRRAHRFRVTANDLKLLRLCRQCSSPGARRA